MLLKVLDYFKKHGLVSTQQLCRTFRIEETALKPILDIWVQKGCIKPCQKTAACQTRCIKCQPVSYFEWVKKSG